MNKRIIAAIDLRTRFESAVLAGLKVAAEHGHTKPADIALHIRVELDRRDLKVIEKRAPKTYIDARGRTVDIDQ
jgi:hypothetical protein